MEKYCKKVKENDLLSVLNSLNSINDDLTVLSKKPLEKVYSNKDMLAILGVTDKTLAKYRNDGELPFRQFDDKYWYTQSDLDHFMDSHTVYAYAV